MKQVISKFPNLRMAASNMPDWLFVLWAGGTALLSYSLVYALRKPFTAAEFDGLQVAGMDYKIVVSIIQLIGYVSSSYQSLSLKAASSSSSVRRRCQSCRSWLSVFCPRLTTSSPCSSTAFRWAACGE